MRPALALALGLALLAPPAALAKSRHAPAPDVIVDQDGGVDDLIAMSLLLKSGQARVVAITICPADSYLKPTTTATQLFVDKLGARGVMIAKGHSEGRNPFPAEWRRDAARVLGIDALKGATPTGANPLAATDAAHTLVRLLSGPRRYTILETGPLTNIADALKLNPAIARHIRRIYIMGGAIRVPGNVSQPGHDGSAEWNLFNQPQAAADVLASGIPITLVPLDATNRVPLHAAFVERLGKQPAMAAQLAAQSWRLLVVGQIDGYYFWDTLTAAAMLDPSLVALKTLKLKVIATGPSQGRTVEAPDGAPIEVALDADQAKVEALFLKVLARP